LLSQLLSEAVLLDNLLHIKQFDRFSFLLGQSALLRFVSHFDSTFSQSIDPC
jgi:hypothetical protein